MSEVAELLEKLDRTGTPEAHVELFAATRAVIEAADVATFGYGHRMRLFDAIGAWIAKAREITND